DGNEGTTGAGQDEQLTLDDETTEPRGSAEASPAEHPVGDEDHPIVQGIATHPGGGRIAEHPGPGGADGEPGGRRQSRRSGLDDRRAGRGRGPMGSRAAELDARADGLDDGPGTHDLTPPSPARGRPART